MAHSMTGFASSTGEHGAFSWSWDIRSVNARGLDIRLRLPDWLEGLEEATRKAIKGRVSRGSVSVGLRLSKQDDTGGVAISAEGLAHALALLETISTEAQIKGVKIAHVSPSDIANMRGVVEQVTLQGDDNAALCAELKSQLPELLDQFITSRAREGQELSKLLSDQVSQIEGLVGQAEDLLDARTATQANSLKESLRRVLDAGDDVDGDRVAQELALLAVKTDVREELDRLGAHVSAARDLLGSDGAMGRKLDFLMQEFNREANTLCSKAQYKSLTSIGLDMKHVIDQMREQVQNVE